MKKLGIIAGEDSLPLTIAESFNGEVYVAAIKNHAEPKEFSDYNCEEFQIGHVGKIIKFFQRHDVTDVVLAGAIRRFNFQDVSVDFDGAILVTKIMAKKFLGDESLLRIVADFIESKAIQIHSPLEYINNSAVATKTKPTKDFLNDIEYARKVVEELGKLDVGQSVIVERGMILGVEAAEGTDHLIKRCFAFAKDGKASILVKMAKPNQDRRLDTPVIGPKTIKNAIDSDMAGIAVEKNSVILIEPQKIVELADKNKFFVHLF